MTTTIEEALEICGHVRCDNMCRPALPARECPRGCNGTGYACGVKPTEVEKRLFRIIMDVEWLIINAAEAAATLMRIMSALDAVNHLPRGGAAAGKHMAEAVRWAMKGRQEVKNDSQDD